MSEAKHSSPPHRAKQMKQWIQPAAKACGNRHQQPMEAGRLQQTRKGNADDLQPDVSFDLEIHGRKTEGLRKYEGTHVECGFRADWDEKVIGQEESGNKTSKKQYAFKQKI